MMPRKRLASKECDDLFCFSLRRCEEWFRFGCTRFVYCRSEFVDVELCRDVRLDFHKHRCVLGHLLNKKIVTTDEITRGVGHLANC